MRLDPGLGPQDPMRPGGVKVLSPVPNPQSLSSFSFPSLPLASYFLISSLFSPLSSSWTPGATFRVQRAASGWASFHIRVQVYNPRLTSFLIMIGSEIHVLFHSPVCPSTDYAHTCMPARGRAGISFPGPQEKLGCGVPQASAAVGADQSPVRSLRLVSSELGSSSPVGSISAVHSCLCAIVLDIAMCIV